MEISYKIGEFDLTLDNLIEQIKLGKISIYDVPISEITHQFLEILRDLSEQLQITDLSFFYRRVSELLYIKSQMLLPAGRIEFDDYSEGDLRNKVIDALEKLKFSKYMALLEQYKEEHSMDLSRFSASFMLPFSDEDLLEGIRLNDLCIVYNKLRENAGAKALEWSLGSKINSNEKLALLLELFEKKDVVTFTELVVDLTSLEHITSAFFAILYAINSKVCTFSQDKAFDEIYLYRAEAENTDEESYDTQDWGESYGTE